MGKYGRQREQTPLAPFEARIAPLPADADIYRALSLTNRYEAGRAFTFPQGLRLFAHAARQAGTGSGGRSILSAHSSHMNVPAGL